MDKGAIIFLLDVNFLPGLKAFVHSAQNAFNDADEDILVISDDPKLFEDPFIQEFADRTILIDPSEIEAFKTINQSSVSDEFMTHEIGAYWFLKFCAFRDYGYSYHLFFDADLICLDDSFRFSDVPSEFDFVAARTIGSDVLKLKDKNHRPKYFRRRYLRRVRRLASRDYKLTASVNSGVMRIGKRFIGAQIFLGLIELATNETFKLEQDVVAEYVRRSDGTFGELPIWMNLVTIVPEVLDQALFAKISDQVKILHYNRNPKSWQKTNAQNDWLDAIWDDRGSP